MIDSHCHLDLDPLVGELDLVIQRAKNVGVTQMVVPAVSRSRWGGLEAMAQTYKGIHVAIGLHPCFEHSDDDLDAMSQRLSQPHPYIAVGECGLDNAAGVLPMMQQIDQCRAQIEVANVHNLPVILHVRKAHNELLQLLNEVPLRAGGVLHGFSGSIEQAKQYIQRDLLIGIGGVCTYERAQKTIETVRQLPIESMLFETDSPDMPLSGHQGKPNQPHQLVKIVTRVAQIRAESIEKLMSAQCDSCRKLFRTPNL